MNVQLMYISSLWWKGKRFSDRTILGGLRVRCLPIDHSLSSDSRWINYASRNGGQSSSGGNNPTWGAIRACESMGGTSMAVLEVIVMLGHYHCRTTTATAHVCIILGLSLLSPLNAIFPPSLFRMRSLLWTPREKRYIPPEAPWSCKFFTG